MTAAGGAHPEDLAADAVAVCWVVDLGFVGVDSSSHVEQGLGELVYINSGWGEI
jgi:hypothetical protein